MQAKAITTALFMVLLCQATPAKEPEPAPSFARAESRVTVRARVPESPRLEANISRWGAGTEQEDSTFQGGIARTDPAQHKPRPARVGQDVYKMWVEKTHPGFQLSLQKIDPAAVIEVKGHWDKADRTLQNLGVPHQTIGSGQLATIPLDKTRVIIINCAGDLPRKALSPVRDFVLRGGYLLTTDWALNNMLEQTFPGYVQWNEGKSRGNVVDAAVVEPDPVLFRGTVTNAHWKLDEESQTLRVLKPSVRVLAKSKELARLDPDRQGILAVTFAVGRGRVLHLVGHFDNNSLPFFPRMLPDPAPGIGISLRQALAANFVLAGLGR